MQYFYRYDLSEIYGWAKLLVQLDDTCIGMENDWF
jgi:butyryl-CoA dehydrogenase